MMFSKACQYGIRAVILIALQSKKGNRIGIREISEIAGTPVSFTAKILQSLTKRKVIASAKGPNGGFYIEGDFSKIKLLDIVDAIDGKDIFNRCALGLNRCSSQAPCPIHHSFAKVRSELKDMCLGSNLEELAQKFSNGHVLKG